MVLKADPFGKLGYTESGTFRGITQRCFFRGFFSGRRFRIHERFFPEKISWGPWGISPLESAEKQLL